MSSIHLELLDDVRRKTFTKLKVLSEEGVLAGGTALSLQIAHRYSFDFDIFLNRPIKPKDYRILKIATGVTKTELDTEDQLTIVDTDGINITLLYYQFKSLFPKVTTPSLPLYDVRDIALDKAYAIGRRAVWRDYVDMYFILDDKYSSIPDIVTLGQKKFGPEFNPKLFLEQLVYFEDLPTAKMSYYKEEIKPETIKSFLTRQVKQFRKEEIL